MKEGGIITLKVEKQGQNLLIAVHDTGVGMDEEHISKLFSPFFTTKPEGNGLGLAEVQKVIQAHGGMIDVLSAPDHGTTFIINLPIVQRI
jgi:signal transduction histidine kinase